MGMIVDEDRRHRDIRYQRAAIGKRVSGGGEIVARGTAEILRLQKAGASG